MRLSANLDSPFWAPVAMHARVFLDFAEMHAVVEADEECGWIDVIMGDDNGETHGEIKTQRLYGRVRIDVTPRASSPVDSVSMKQNG